VFIFEISVNGSLRGIYFISKLFKGELLKADLINQADAMPNDVLSQL